MMKGTGGLGWRSLVSKLHPPLPMSPKDSARLLNLLNASFKQELDRRHPETSLDNEHGIHLHLRSLLTNPLLDGRKNSLRRRSHGQKTSNIIPDYIKEPMEVFRRQVENGSATLTSASLCLQAHHNNCLASPSYNLADVMRASGAGKSIVEWLWSSGSEDNGEFYLHGGLVTLLVKFLVAESQHGRIEKWLRQLAIVSDETTLSLAVRQRRSSCYRMLLKSYVRSEMLVGKGLGSAMSIYIKVLRDYSRDSEPEQNRVIYEWMAYKLTHAFMDTPDTEKPAPTVIGQFLTTTKMLNGRYFSGLAAFHDIYLAVDHKLEPALEYFRTLSPLMARRLPSKARPYHILLGLRTAELCLDKGLKDEAKLIMEKLTEVFPHDVRPPSIINPQVVNPRDQDSERRRSEELNLHLLESLAAA